MNYPELEILVKEHSDFVKEGDKDKLLNLIASAYTLGRIDEKYVGINPGKSTSPKYSGPYRVLDRFSGRIREWLER